MIPAVMSLISAPDTTVNGARPVVGSTSLSLRSSLPAFWSVNDEPAVGFLNSISYAPGGISTNLKEPLAAVVAFLKGREDPAA